MSAGCWKTSKETPKGAFSYVYFENIFVVAQARTLFRRGLLVEPGNAFLLHALGMLEYKAGEVPSALRALIEGP